VSIARQLGTAALLAARNDESAVALKEFNDAVERVTAGLEKKAKASKKTKGSLDKEGVAIGMVAP